MHAGKFETPAEVLNHYNQAAYRIRAPAFGHNNLEILTLSEEQLAQLEAFLRRLSR